MAYYTVRLRVRPNAGGTSLFREKFTVAADSRDEAGELALDCVAQKWPNIGRSGFEVMEVEEG